ncbi:hypothetical protein K450DRAFT_226921 [Umbelopsis ramanniana AG]|uniref:CXXC-type zinc finger protein 1 n=1 Tax=Umbelopsis ramanniana AG TaxID=1314678 RepID=A0AAD5EG88_UMBRA|nr:uncharacterized protein K450DRAFT_226921 [Umbelopsis ramanniana AG]KAI8582792.1 hypothetical protein K450DRAFT_226921 [Umbelopsis ramanniana AG]
MQPNDGHYRQWQLPSKEKQDQSKEEQAQPKKSALNISALLNREPSMNNQAEAPKATDLPSSTPSLESYSSKPPSLQTNMQITPSPTSESPSATLTFHQYEPPAAAEATAKRLPLRKRLTMENKVQLHQQVPQQPQTNTPSSISPPVQEAPALPAPLAPASVVTAAPPQATSETALDSDNTETDEEKGSVEIYNPVVVQPASSEASSPVVKMKPLKKAKVWGSLNSLQGHTTHQNSVVNTQSQIQFGETSESAPDSGTKREIADDIDLPASKRPKSANDSPPPAPSSKAPSSSSSSDELYCICRKPYDKPRFMIACDECDQWFHGECVGMSERDGGLIELYYCPGCSRATGKQTSWKVKCANPACLKPARTAKSKHRGNKEDESKYCSGDCGLLLARARIANCDKKRRAALEDVRTSKSHGAKVRSAADMDDRKLLVTLREEQAKLEETIARADRRSRFLKLVIRRQQEHKSNDAGMEEVKSLGMKAKRADEGGICGFDSRLLWEDEESWSHCLEQEDDDAAIKLIEEGSHHLCLSNRKCQRHAQWQKLKAAEIDLERSEDVQALQKLKKQRHQAKVRMKQRREKVTEIVNNGVIDHRLSSVVA